MERVQDVENVLLIAYFCKKTGKIGSMRFVDNDNDKIKELTDFMKKELQDNINGVSEKLAELYKNTASPKRKDMNELEELMHYFKNIDVVVLKPKDAKTFEMEAYKV